MTFAFVEQILPSHFFPLLIICQCIVFIPPPSPLSSLHFLSNLNHLAAVRSSLTLNAALQGYEKPLSVSALDPRILKVVVFVCSCASS